MNISEQRKEIASRLRNPDSLNSEGCIITAGICLKISSTLIADLIDPTCEMEDAGDVPDSIKDTLDTFFCSKCGSPIYNDMSPSYCPYCGARVVNINDAD